MTENSALFIAGCSLQQQQATRSSTAVQQYLVWFLSEHLCMYNVTYTGSIRKIYANEYIHHMYGLVTRRGCSIRAATQGLFIFSVLYLDDCPFLITAVQQYMWYIPYTPYCIYGVFMRFLHGSTCASIQQVSVLSAKQVTHVPV